MFTIDRRDKRRRTGAVYNPNTRTNLLNKANFVLMNGKITPRQQFMGVNFKDDVQNNTYVNIAQAGYAFDAAASRKVVSNSPQNTANAAASMVNLRQLIAFLALITKNDPKLGALLQAYRRAFAKVNTVRMAQASPAAPATAQSSTAAPTTAQSSTAAPTTATPTTPAPPAPPSSTTSSGVLDLSQPSTTSGIPQRLFTPGMDELSNEERVKYRAGLKRLKDNNNKTDLIDIIKGFNDTTIDQGGTKSQLSLSILQHDEKIGSGLEVRYVRGEIIS